jgi:hypothetical protein
MKTTWAWVWATAFFNKNSLYGVGLRVDKT